MTELVEARSDGIAVGAAAPPAALAVSVEVRVGAPPAAFAVSVELELARGVAVLFGPSGCGKSITLQAIVGTLAPSAGRLVLHGRTLFDASLGVAVLPHERGIGYVPQHHALFPFATVAENVTFGLPRARRRRVEPEIAALRDELGIASLGAAMPDRLSGGERQRVALARALATRPKLLVLDEPFASIDMTGRAALRRVLRETLARRNLSAVLVTHDPVDALELGDTLVRFERGRTLPPESPSCLVPEHRAAFERAVVARRS